MNKRTRSFLFLGCLVTIAGLCHAASPLSDLKRLEGKWQRPDGGYILEIKEVAEDGKMQAAYFNPRPIHVEKAEAVLENGKILAFIELQDINYPGSNYHLSYDPAKDVLVGTYFQAVQREEYEIYFQRVAS